MDSVSPLQLLVVSVSLALIPMVISSATSYLKLSIVIGMLKNALGTQQAPSNLIVMVLSLTLSVFVMTPVIKNTYKEILRSAEINKKDIKLNNLSKIIINSKNIFTPWCQFIEKHGDDKEKKLFHILSIRNNKSLETEHKSISSECIENAHIFFPAFILSELKEGFSMAFTLLLPFLVVDLVIAHILVGLGMFMVSPVMISLPVKLLLFVLADGWILISKGLVLSYG